MTLFTLNVNIDDSIVSLNQWKLCFARAVQSGKGGTNMDVVAFADDAKKSMKVTWKDDEFGAASKTSFLNGLTVKANTRVVPIVPGQKFILSDWKESPKVVFSDEAPPDGFVFEAAPPAAALLYQTVNDTLVPVYISPHTPLRSSFTEPLTPLRRVGIWFQKDAESGDMFTDAAQDILEVAMTTDTMTASYSKGSWTITTGTVSYSLDRRPKSLTAKVDNADQKEGTKE